MPRQSIPTMITDSRNVTTNVMDQIPVTTVTSTSVINTAPVTAPAMECNTHRSDGVELTTGHSTKNDCSANILKDIIDYIANKNDDLPSKEPDVFKGSVFQFPLWLQSFETLVEKKREDARDRLYYLGVYTTGEPYEAIEPYLILDSDEAYREAKETNGWLLRVSRRN